MRIDSNTSTIESSGLGEQGSFSIKTTAAAFQLLSSGLYTNKIRAVVRELSCNAIDAHVMPGGSGSATPIEVKLPNALDSQFYVKDSGPGLSHAKVMSLYTTYFDSSKQQSDEFIGGFGVGSKSPFAYTDSFTVESRHGGMKNVYSAYIGDDGSPKIAQMASLPMEQNDTTGLTVSMPVRPNDFGAFEREALDLFKWFDTTPALLGTPKSVQKMQLVPTSDPKVSLRSTSGYGQYVLVRMGQVVYAVDNYRTQASPEVVEALATMQQFRPLLDVPIGAISVAASREDVAYDKKTKAYLDTAIKGLYKSIGFSITEHLKTLDLNTLKGRFAGYTFLSNYGLASASLLSSKDFDDTVKAGKNPPQLNRLLAENGVNPDPFLPIFQGLREPAPEQAKYIKVSMPYVKDTIKNWVSSPYRSWDTNAYRQPFSLLELDLDPTLLYAERARKNYAIKHPSASSRTILLQRKDGVSDADYEKAKKEILASWGMPDQELHSLVSFMSKEDKARYEKSNATQAVPALTFFSTRSSICTSDIKNFYYIPWENDRIPDTEIPAHFEKSALQKFISECQDSNADLVKGFFRDLGADGAGVGRLYLIHPAHLSKVKNFSGGTNLLNVLKTGLNHDTFQQKWQAWPTTRDTKASTQWLTLVDPAAYNTASKNVSASALDVLKDTQLGQLLAWYKNLPSITYTSNGEPDDKSQYALLAQKLIYATRSPLPDKVISTSDLTQKVHTHYPMLSPYIQSERWSFTAEKLEMTREYLQMRDEKMNATLLPGVTINKHVTPTLGFSNVDTPSSAPTF